MTYHHHHRLDGCEWCDGRHGLWGAFVLGIGILALGMILMLDNFSLIDASVFAPWWPVLLMVFGLSHLVQPEPSRRMGWGLSWIAVGAIILLHNLDVIAVGLTVLWPVVLVIIGANLLVRGLRRSAGGWSDEGRRGPGPAA